MPFVRINPTATEAPYPCRVVSLEPHLPYPGWSMDIECGEGKTLYALFNPKACEIARLDAHPADIGIGTAAFPLIEEQLRRLGRCRSVRLIPMGRMAQRFYESLGFECLRIFGGSCMEMEKRFQP